MMSTRTLEQTRGWDGSSLGTRTFDGADPLGFAAGDTNLFRYVGADPENETDPSGLEGKGWWTQIPTSFKPPKGWWYYNPVIKEQIIDAWNDSNPLDPAKQHEEGGWIYWNPTTNKFGYTRFPPGKPASGNQEQLTIDKIPKPTPPPGFITIGFFHTHPPNYGRWDECTSEGTGDKHFKNFYNVPDLIISIPTFPEGRQNNPTDPNNPWQPNPYFPNGPPKYPSRLK